MKQVVLMTMILSLSAFGAKSLKSKEVKGRICSELESFAYDDYTKIDVAKCVKVGKFKVTKSTFNQQINKVSNLLVSFEYEENNIEFAGTIEAFRIVSFLENGSMSVRWSTRKMKVEVNDKRNWVNVFNELLDNDEINIHNGDADVRKVLKTHTEADLVKSLEESLENLGDPEGSEYDFCLYETETGFDSVNYYMKDHSPALARLLKDLEKKGLIKGAAYRGYSDGASEYCSHYYFEILTKDNKVLYVDFDFTT